MKEAHRRARRYCNDYGILGRTLLAISAMYVYCRDHQDYGGYSKDIWNSTTALWPQLKESPVLSMDSSSGLRLIPHPDVWLSSQTSWQVVLGRNGWLSSYLYLSARSDIVQSFVGLKSSLPLAWCRCLPFDRSTVSSLRATLSSAQPDDISYSSFLSYISIYFDVSQAISFLHR